MKNLYKGLLVAIWSVGLWLSAGNQVSAQTPILLKTAPLNSSGLRDNFYGLVAASNGLYFHSGNYLWRTDGTPAGTALVKNPAGQSVLSNDFSEQLVVNGRLYFNSGNTLMYVDESGLARNVNATYTGGVRNMFAVDNQLYFATSGGNLWYTYGDGTQATLLGTYPSTPSTQFTAYKGQLYFLKGKVFPDYNLATLCRIALPSSVATVVKDITIESEILSFLQVVGDKLYIGGFINSANSAGPKPVLYQSDGTAGGTLPISNAADLNEVISFYQPKVVNDQLYLIGFSGYSVRALTGPIYKVNSVGNSLELAPDIYGRLPAGIGLLHPADFTSYKGLIYFSAYGGNRDYELWRSDGTLVKDIQTGPGSSDPQNFYVHNGVLYFNADGSSSGRELYRTDGTEGGTQLIADLLPGPAGSSPANLITYDNELYFTTGNNIGATALWKLPADVTTPPITGLTVTPPAYDCNTGQLTLATTGGNGQPIEYRIAGLRDWSGNNVFTIPTYQRTGTTFTLEARQSGQVVSLPFATACQSTPPVPPTPPTGTGLTLAAPAYDCNTGRLQLGTIGGNGQLVEYRIAGLRDWAAGNTFTVPTYQRTGIGFTLEARQSGQGVSLAFTSACQTTPPPVTPPVTPPAGTPLSVNAQSLDCQTGALQLGTAGGDGTPIDYKVPGLRDYAASTIFTVPTYQRSGTSFTLFARQSGRVVTAIYPATCPVGARLASAETIRAFDVVVYPNPVGEEFTVGVRGAAGQAVRFHLTNLSGQTVVEQRAQVASDEHTETLRMPTSGAGLYLLRVSTAGQSKIVKVLKP